MRSKKIKMRALSQRSLLRLPEKKKMKTTVWTASQKRKRSLFPPLKTQKTKRNPIKKKKKKRRTRMRNLRRMAVTKMSHLICDRVQDYRKRQRRQRRRKWWRRARKGRGNRKQRREKTGKRKRDRGTRGRHWGAWRIRIGTGCWDWMRSRNGRKC